MVLAEEAYQAGQWIGRKYQIIRRLGHGGDGTVYLVRHGPTEQLRAAKLLKNDMVKRRHELDMMKRLRHPALPQIYDVLEASGELWLIMEFIAGRSLSELCAEEKALGPARFYSIARQLSDALVYLHSRRPPVLHLDIKPSNIMLRNDGTLVLIDFGAAIHAVSSETGSLLRFGTPGFAAPEQRDPGADLDARADIYGFGAVLYYCLYGAPPGRGMADGRLAAQGNRRVFSAGKHTAGPIRLRQRGSLRRVFSEGKYTADRRLFLRSRPEDAARRNIAGGRRVPGGFSWKRNADALIRRCLEENADRRFPNTPSLYRFVRKAEKRFLLWQQLRKSAAAASFLLAVAIFAAVDFHRDGQSEAKAVEVSRDYRLLLQQADGLGFAQAAESYKQALALCPEDGAWCERFLNRIEEDYSFSMEEENVFKELIFSVPQGRTETEEELLEKHSPDYGRLAYRVGLAYWYFYEGAGGKSAAAKWFGQAVSETQGEAEDVGSDSEQWLKSARIHARISSYYEKLGKTDENGNQTAEIGAYWRDLTELWELDGLGQEETRIRSEIAVEMLSILIMQGYELNKSGVSLQQMQEIVDSANAFFSEDAKSGRQAQSFRAQCDAARKAVERLSGNERGNELDTEKEEQG